MIFLDEINRRNPTPRLGEIESTNPCGEVPLLPFEACNLGSINLDRMLVERRGEHELDYEKLKDTVDAGIRFLDNVIDVSRYPLKQIDLHRQREPEGRSRGDGVRRRAGQDSGSAMDRGTRKNWLNESSRR